MEGDGERQPGPAQRFYQDGLTGLRALAVAWVLLFHLNSIVGPKVIAVTLFSVEIELHPLLTVGWVGANLFFVLSGFLLTTHLLERLATHEPGPTYRRYFAARIRRVFPAYWFQIAVLLAVALATTRAFPEWIRFLPLHSVMIHNVSQEASWAINPVYWTLPIEFSFYLVLPFIAGVLSRAEKVGGSRRWRILLFVVLAMLALSWGYRFLVFNVYRLSGVGTLVWAMNQIPGTIDQFVLGGAAATALRWARPQVDGWLPRFRARMATALAVVGLMGIVGMMYFIDDIFEIFWGGHWALFVWYTLTSLFIAVLLAGIAISSAFTRAVFANRVVLFIGTISYSIYLWHYPIAVWIWQAFPATTAHGLAPFLLVAVPVIVVVSAASYYCVERPFLMKKGPAHAGPSGTPVSSKNQFQRIQGS